MSEKLEQALSFSNYRQTLNNQLQKLKIKTEGLLIFSIGGGSFTINRELICFLDYLTRTKVKEATLLDDNNVPVLIIDIEIFLKNITQRYFDVTTDYHKEFQLIRKARSVKSILDIKDEE